jgi:hypothetical protein
MRELISLANRYSIYDYRNLYDIIGVNPDGRKRTSGRKHTLGSNGGSPASPQRKGAASEAEMPAAAGGR